MIGEIPLAVFNSAGIVGLLALSWWMLITGRVVPGNLHQARMADKDAQIATLTAAADRRAAQVDKLMAVGDMQIQVLESMKRIAEERRP